MSETSKAFVLGNIYDGFDYEQIKKLLSGIDSGLAIAQSVLIGFGMMFILCTAILMQAVK